MTAKRCLGSPETAPTGQALWQRRHPMQRLGSMRATAKGSSRPYSESISRAGCPVSAASFSTPFFPPGAQRLISARSSAMARAYCAHPSKPHWRHWVWGKRRQSASARRSVVFGSDIANIERRSCRYSRVWKSAAGKNQSQKLSARSCPGSPFLGLTMPRARILARTALTMAGLPHSITRLACGVSLTSAVASSRPLSRARPERRRRRLSGPAWSPW